MQISFEMEDTFVAKARGSEFPVAINKLPEASLRKVFEYGMQRILNDACAGATNEEEAVTAANTKWENLVNGILRSSPNREGDPIKAEAKRIALAHVVKAKGFVAWLQANGFKQANKEAKAKASELAAELAKREDILATAKSNVEAARGLEIEIEL